MTERSHFDEGFQAYVVGLSLDSCPYAPGSREDVQWRAGWAFAKSMLGDA